MMVFMDNDLKKKIFLKYLYIKKEYWIIYNFFKLLFIIKKINPDIIQCWMYHGDLFGGLAARLLRKKNLLEFKKFGFKFKMGK